MTWGRKVATVHILLQKSLKKADGAGDELRLRNHRARKPEAEGLLAWGTGLETMSAKQLMTAGFVSELRKSVLYFT